MRAIPDKPAGRPFSMFGGTRRSTLTLSSAPAPAVVAKSPAPTAPVAKPPVPKVATAKPATPTAATPKPPAPSPAPDPDPAVAARMAALATARREFPDIFNDSYPPLLGNINQLLKEVVGDGRAAQAAVEWWVTRPGFRQARKARQRPPVPKETLAAVQAMAPALFDPAAPRPLAIGFHDQLTAQGIAPDAAGALLRFWTSRPAYRRALAKGGSRYNLDGSEAGPISTEHQQDAGLKAGKRH